MTWRSFVDFWIMREMGHEDAVFRNYDLMKHSGSKGGHAALWGALKRIGMPAKHLDEAINHVPEVAQRLADCGVPKPDYEQVRVRLVAWYTWDRIRKGDIQQWFMADHIRRGRGNA